MAKSSGVKFEIGDIVYCNHSNTGVCDKKERGTVVSFNDRWILLEFHKEIGSDYDSYSHRHTVDTPKKGDYYWSSIAHNLTHVKVRNSKLARKIHKNYREVDKNWIIPKE